MKAELVFNPNVPLDYDFLFIVVEGRENTIRLSYDDGVFYVVIKEDSSESYIKTLKFTKGGFDSWTRVPIELKSLSNEDILNSIPNEFYL